MEKIKELIEKMNINMMTEFQKLREETKLKEERWEKEKKQLKEKIENMEDRLEAIEKKSRKNNFVITGLKTEGTIKAKVEELTQNAIIKTAYAIGEKGNTKKIMVEMHN